MSSSSLIVALRGVADLRRLSEDLLDAGYRLNLPFQTHQRVGASAPVVNPKAIWVAIQTVSDPVQHASVGRPGSTDLIQWETQIARGSRGLTILEIVSEAPLTLDVVYDVHDVAARHLFVHEGTVNEHRERWCR